MPDGGDITPQLLVVVRRCLLFVGIWADSSSPLESSVISPKIKKAVRDTEHRTQCVHLYLQSPISLHGFVLVKRVGTTLPAPLLRPKVMRMVLLTNYIKISNSHIRGETRNVER